MTKELSAGLAIIGLLITLIGGMIHAVREFDELKAEVREINVHLVYLHGTGWHPPAEAK